MFTNNEVYFIENEVQAIVSELNSKEKANFCSNIDKIKDIEMFFTIILHVLERCNMSPNLNYGQMYPHAYKKNIALRVFQQLKVRLTQGWKPEKEEVAQKEDPDKNEIMHLKQRVELLEDSLSKLSAQADMLSNAPMKMNPYSRHGILT